METDTVQQAGVSLCVIDYHVVTCCEGVDGRNYALVAEVEKEGVLLLLEVREHFLQLLVKGGVA